MKNGVPWDVAFDLDADEMLAFCVIFGEFEGNSWDWPAMRWKERK